MPQVSKRLIQKKTQEKIQKLFFFALTKCTSASLTQELVEDLLTPTEQVMLSKRFAIAYMLEANYDYRTIAQILKVSSTTIGMVALSLKHRGKGLRQILAQIKKDESLGEFFSSIKDAIQDIIASTPGQDWSKSKNILHQSRRERKKTF